MQINLPLHSFARIFPSSQTTLARVVAVKTQVNLVFTRLHKLSPLTALRALEPASARCKSSSKLGFCSLNRSFHLLCGVCLFNYPIFDVACIARHVGSYLYYCTSLLLEWQGVLFVVYLRHGFGGCAVELQFNDVKVLLGAYEQVYASVDGAVLGLDIKPHEFGNYVHDVLVVVLEVLHQFVGGAGHETLQLTHEVVGFTTSYACHKFAYDGLRLFLLDL